jgi:hypothetical protein
VTYTFMTPYLKAFFYYLGNVEVTGVSAHTYGNSGELKWMAGMMDKEFKKPVWVTEFADWHASRPDDEINYMIQSVDFFENSPYVAGYAWFKERVRDNSKLSILAESGKLTKLGETYVNMPVHDPNVYYQLPGRLQAESYVQAKDADLALTKDTDGGFLEMEMIDSGALDYNIAVPRAGSYAVKVRFAAGDSGKVEILSGDNILATAQATSKGWQTATTQIQLPAGNQTIRVKSDSAVRLNWIEFGSGS